MNIYQSQLLEIYTNNYGSDVILMKDFRHFKNELKTMKIACIGAGVSNIPLIKYLNKLDCDLTLFDNKNYNDLNEDIKSLIDNNVIKAYLGEDSLTNLEGFDIIFRSPSMLPTNPYLEKEKKRGAIITTEVEQVIKYSKAKIIGVTGSKGKTTTTTIINEILTGMNYKTYLGGNIGIPLFDKIDEITENDIVILELSSFQLMSMEFSPNVAVITNISPDHLDIHGSYEEYINAKKYLFKNQKETDLVILNNDDSIVKDFYKEAKGEVKYFGMSPIKDSYVLDNDFICYNGKKILDTKKFTLKGTHNYINVCAALNAVKEYINVENDELENIIANINSVHHRLEFVREINSVKWYNDSASTTPDKSLAGINAFDSDIVLIAGGYDKNISYTPLAKPIINKVSKLILFGDTKNKIYDAVMEEIKNTKNVKTKIYIMDSLEEVIDIAYKVAIPGEVVLFSPASASFDMFKNAYQRGDLFKELVNKL